MNAHDLRELAREGLKYRQRLARDRRARLEASKMQLEDLEAKNYEAVLELGDPSKNEKLDLPF